MAFNRATRNGGVVTRVEGKGYLTRADLHAISEEADRSMERLRRIFREEFGEEGISGLDRLLNLVRRGRE